MISVPLRGVGCFEDVVKEFIMFWISVPLRGVGCFPDLTAETLPEVISVPLRGVGCFLLGQRGGERR